MDFIITLVIIVVMFFTLPEAAGQLMTSSILAESHARNLGNAFDVIALSPGNVTIEKSCPKDVIFVIDHNQILVLLDGMSGTYTADYYYMIPTDARFPTDRVVIDCNINTIVELRKYEEGGYTQIEYEGTDG
ncbi:MAG: hypothetical protein ABIG20_02135 [archaeon]